MDELDNFDDEDYEEDPHENCGPDCYNGECVCTSQN